MSNPTNNQNDNNSKPQRSNFNQYVNNNNTMRSHNPRGNNNYKNNVRQPFDNQTERYFNRNANNQQKSYQKSRLNQQNENLGLENDLETNRSKQSRLISISSSTGASITCICCLHELETYAYYLCQHYVCLKCAVKMRILCQKIDCPVCRRESKQIICTKKPIEDDKNLDELIKNCPNYSRPYKLEPMPSCAQMKPPEPESLPNAGINFESDEIKEEYNEILSSKCKECDKVFREFDLLDQHMRKVHRQFYCELCLENLKLFPYERKSYTREDLATHKRNGDKTGEFKGHPLCHYCDNRFYDRDDLYRHYRKEHYFCHFCDSDGHEEYYKNYPELRAHFLEAHYLCELDRCSYNAAETHEYVVFRNELDLQAHKKQVHAKNKNDHKAYGKINIEFNVNRDRDRDRATNTMNRQRNNQQQNRNNRNRTNNNLGASNAQSTSEEDDEQVQQQKTQITKSELLDHNEFPSVLKSIEEDNKKQSEILKKEENKPVSNELTDSIMPVSDTSQATASSSQWRYLIAQGAPKINQEAEFPSLSSTIDPKSTQTTLADLGFKPVAVVQPTLTPTPTISKRQAKKEAKKKQQEQVESFPALTSVVKPVQPVQNTKSPTLATIASKTTTAVPTPAPPPGFSPNLKPSSLPTPPPGFEASKSFSSTNDKSSNLTYIKPQYYDVRNEQLSINLKNLFGIFDESEYESFRSLSIEFRKNRLDANSYLAKSRALLDGPLFSENFINKENLETINSHLKFIDLIQEMIVLLPDVEKQNELYKAFIEYANSIKTKLSQTNEPVTQSNKKVWSKNVASPPLNKLNESKRIVNIQLKNCEYCNQYLLSTEFDDHQAKIHNVKFLEQKSVINNKLDEEYPSLSSTVTTTTNESATNQTAALFLQKKETSTKPSFKSTSSKPSDNPEEFPPLSAGLVNNDQTRFSALPTSALFSNPSSHLSLVNKKKHRLQK